MKRFIVGILTFLLLCSFGCSNSGYNEEKAKETQKKLVDLGCSFDKDKDIFNIIYYSSNIDSLCQILFTYDESNSLFFNSITFMVPDVDNKNTLDSKNRYWSYYIKSKDNKETGKIYYYDDKEEEKESVYYDLKNNTETENSRKVTGEEISILRDLESNFDKCLKEMELTSQDLINWADWWSKTQNGKFPKTEYDKIEETDKKDEIEKDEPEEKETGIGLGKGKVFAGDGLYNLISVDEKLVTKKNLEKWYFNIVKPFSDTYDYFVILYDGYYVPPVGVYATKGLVQVNVKFTKEEYEGMEVYSMTDIDDSNVITYYSNGDKLVKME